MTGYRRSRFRPSMGGKSGRVVCIHYSEGARIVEPRRLNSVRPNTSRTAAATSGGGSGQGPWRQGQASHRLTTTLSHGPGLARGADGGGRASRHDRPFLQSRFLIFPRGRTNPGSRAFFRCWRTQGWGRRHISSPSDSDPLPPLTIVERARDDAQF